MLFVTTLDTSGEIESTKDVGPKALKRGRSSSKARTLANIPAEYETPSTPPKTPLGAQAKEDGATRREKADGYGGVVLRLSFTYRLVVCGEGRQWIIQKRKASDDWRAKLYFARAKHIAPSVRNLIGEEAASKVDAWASSLPLEI